MGAVILLGIAGTAYCAAYFVYCLRRAAAWDAVGAAFLIALSLAAMLFCTLP